MINGNETNISVKKVILLIKESIFFNKVKDIKQNVVRNTIVISSKDDVIKKDMSSYHEYYMKYKKSA